MAEIEAMLLQQQEREVDPRESFYQQFLVQHSGYSVMELGCTVCNVAIEPDTSALQQQQQQQQQQTQQQARSKLSATAATWVPQAVKQQQQQQLQQQQQSQQYRDYSAHSNTYGGGFGGIVNSFTSYMGAGGGNMQALLGYSDGGFNSGFGNQYAVVQQRYGAPVAAVPHHQSQYGTSQQQQYYAQEQQQQAVPMYAESQRDAGLQRQHRYAAADEQESMYNTSSTLLEDQQQQHQQLPTVPVVQSAASTESEPVVPIAVHVSPKDKHESSDAHKQKARAYKHFMDYCTTTLADVYNKVNTRQGDTTCSACAFEFLQPIALC
jgi:hypothetical protein